MADCAREAIFLAMSLISGYNEEKAQRVEMLEKKVDDYEDELGSYLVKLSGGDLAAKENRILSLLLHNIGDLEENVHPISVMFLPCRRQPSFPLPGLSGRPVFPAMQKKEAKPPWQKY